jgi:CMP-N,N'-diacetyllegionaminic acid synthase
MANSRPLNVAAVIPARGGSKGISGKNIIEFCGKPLLAWSIEQAAAAQGVASVWVSSDSDEILEVAGRYGARPVKRPEAISGDTATSESAWLHALDTIEAHGERLDIMLAMQATSPLRESSDIERALQDFQRQGCDSLFSCAELEDFFIWEKDGQGNYLSLNYDYLNRKRRQDVGRQYVENGSFYLFKPDILRKFNNRLGGKIGISMMQFWKTFEIDSMDDLKFCELLMNKYLPAEK